MAIMEMEEGKSTNTQGRNHDYHPRVHVPGGQGSWLTSFQP